MATLAFKPYTYKPTPPRSTSTATRSKSAPKQVIMLDKLQQIESSSVFPRPAADVDGGYRPGIQGTGNIYSGSDKANNDENDDDRDLRTLEDLLFIKLQAQGFTKGVRGLDKTSEVEEVSVDEKGSSIDQSRSVQSDNSSKSPDDPIVLLGESNSSASEAEAYEVILRAESAIVSGAGLFDSPETAIDLTTPFPSRSSDGWHYIDNFLEPAPRSRFAEQGAPTPDSLPHTPSRISSEPLYDSISTEGSRRARSEATTSSSRLPTHHARASLETQLSQQGHLYTGQGVADEHELIDHSLDTFLIDEGTMKQQEVEQEQEQNEGNTEDEDEGRQQEMNIVALVVTAERADGSPRLANQEQSPPNLNSSPEPSYNEAESRSGGDGDGEINSTDSAEDNEKEPCLAKRKQQSLSHDGPIRKKHRRPLQESSSCRRKPLSKPHRQYLKSHSPLDQCSRVATSSIAKDQLPSLVPSILQSKDTKMSRGNSNLSSSSRATPPMLTEITFCPRSAHCYSFTAVVRDGCDGRGVSLAQLARLIASTGHVGKIDDFTIKPIEQHLYLVSGLSRHTSALIPAEAGHDHVDVTRTRPQDGKAVNARDDDESGLSDSDPELGSDGDGRSSEDELGRLGMRTHVPWDPIDEQRLLAYKKEGKSWKWIFRQFLGRTQAAVRTRLNIVQARGE